MKTTINYGGKQIEIDDLRIISDESEPTIPPAGVHPVVQDQGKTVTLTSPVKMDMGDTFSFSSGYAGMDYGVTVEICILQADGGFSISGVIGERKPPKG